MTRPPAVGVSSASTGSIRSDSSSGSSGEDTAPVRSPGATEGACQNARIPLGLRRDLRSYDQAPVDRAPSRRVASVGVNALFLRPQMGGLETYVRELVPALLEVRPDLRLVVFATAAGRELLAAEAWADAVELVESPVASRPYARALSEVAVVGRLASQRRLDVLHSVALLGPLWTRARSVITVADVTWLREPKSVEPTTRLLWRTLVPLAVRRAARVIT